MHDIRSIRDNPADFDAGLRSRGLAPLSGALIALDEARRGTIGTLQAAQERRNALSQKIGAAKKARDESGAALLMEEVARLKADALALDEAERAATKALNDRLAEIPNLPGSDVPVGPDEKANVVRHVWGSPGDIVNPKQHFELGEAWRGGGGTLMDFEAAAKLSGSRFVVLRGQLARLERALGQFMLDLHTTEHGYTEVSPPLMVREEAMFGTAQLPKFEEDQFAAVRKDDFARQLDYAAEDFEVQNRTGTAMPAFAAGIRKVPFWLIPTAEVPLTNLVRESILAENELPLRFTALTPCFRAEAGAAGRDTRGMLRQHQFTKCELVSIVAPDRSAEEHERMLASAETVLKRLELPYRVVTLCTGDMGFASTKTWDIEVWMPGQGTFREVSSCSVCGDFQARRMNARYRPKGEKSPRFVHTLNGSGVAVGRALIAVLENGQEPDGSVTIPSALRPYMGGLERIGGA